MKISLVVASGVHTGKVIAVPGTQLIIGREEGCHLRPASPAISKKHCAIFIRDSSAFIRDFGSTNGTFINDVQVLGDQPVKSGDLLKIGPLDFTIQLTTSGKTDSTPLPDDLKSVKAPIPTGTPAGGVKPLKTENVKHPIPRVPVDEQDQIAAMLLGMGDEEPGTDPKVPDGSTEMNIPAVDGLKDGKPDDKKKAVITAAESSAAASDILRKYMRRPK